MDHALIQIINGTNGNNTIVGTSGGDLIDGRGGDDDIAAMAGGDHVNGGEGDDLLRSANDFETAIDDGGNAVYGDGGDDALWGGSDEDELYGGTGADVITEGSEGDAALDKAYGEGGDDEIDVVSVPARKDIVDCGSGTDHVEADALDEISSNCESVNRLTSGEIQAAYVPGICQIYRTFEPTNFGPQHLRWGDRTFGYRHIRDKHGYMPRRIGYILNHGSVIEVNGYKQTVQGRYPGDSKPFRVVFNDSVRTEKCPGVRFGIVTAYHPR